jgi:hypothetical protein
MCTMVAMMSLTFPSPAVSAVNFVTEASDVAGNGMTARTYDMGASNVHELSVFAIWTPAATPVPALPPIAQGLLIVAMAGAAAVARKRQQCANDRIF